MLLPGGTETLMAAATSLGALALGVGGWTFFTPRITPQERERLRRLKVNAEGRMGDALLVEVREGIAHYTYTLRGVDYAASQDIRALQALLPSDLETLSSHAVVKYLPRNPANSILLCEGWSGLYPLPRAAPPFDRGTAA